MKRYLLVLTVLVVTLGRLFAHSPADVCVKSTEGKDFWFGFMENRNYQVPQFPYFLPIVHYTEITLISVYRCNVSVYIGKSSTPAYTRILDPNTPAPIRIPWPDVESIGSEIIQNKGIHLVSDNPLNVYALNWCENSADVAVIYPKESIGNEYYTMCYTPSLNYHFDADGNEVYGSGRNSEFLIVATEDHTEISITPSKITDNLRPANVPFTVMLDKGESYQVQSLNHANLAGQGDLTGSYIKSDRPIAVFSGALATSVPADPNVDSWDHLYEQMPPLPSWGRKFVTVPLVGRTEDRFRVLASQNNTTIRIGGKITTVLNQSENYEFVLRANEPTLIESDRPVLLAQYMVSNSVDRPPGLTIWDWDGDPFMVIVNPVDQTRESSTFVAYDSQNIKNKYYVNIVTKDDAVNQILLDDNAISFQNLANSGYSFAQVKIDKGKHNLKSTEAGKGFIAYVYAYGNPESFGYNVGFNVNVKLDLGGDLRFLKDTMLICNGETKILDAGSQFSTFLWNTGETSQKINVNHQGNYNVTASTAAGCILSDNVVIVESNPVINLGKDSTFCHQSSFMLDAGAGFSSYLWSTKEITPKITVSKDGVYDVLAVNKFGCPVRDTIRIGFSSEPKIVIKNEDTQICGSLSTVVKISSNTSTYSLTSSNHAVSVHDLTVTVPQYGNYPFSYVCTNEFGCVSDTSFEIGFLPAPQVNFVVNKAVVCEKEEVKFSAVTDGNVLSYLWEWGDGTSDHQLKEAVHTYVRNGHYDVQLTVNYDNKCPSIILRKEVVSVESIPSVDFSIPNNQCLTVGPHTLKYTGTGDELDDYNWDLSGFQPGEVIDNPGHTRGDLVFDLKIKPNNSLSLQVVSKYGCKSETKSLQLRRNPSFAVFSSKVEGCAPLSLDFNAVTNDAVDQIAYSWDFGNGDTGTGSQVPYTYSLPKQSYDIRVLADSRTTGCRDTLVESQWISVFPLPNADFSVQNPMHCMTEDFSFMAVEDGAGVQYNWNLGDNTMATGKNVLHKYSVDGHYEVSLNVISGVGCTNQSLPGQSIYAAPVPTIGFSVDPATCLNPGNNSLNYEGTATDKDLFNWDLSEFDQAEIIQNPLTTSGPLTFNLLNKPLANIYLQVVSQYGCVTENKKLTVRRKPIFTFDADPIVGCPPLVVALKARPGDAVDRIDYHWDFGDGESATGQEITHAFTIPDRYYDLSVQALSKTTGCTEIKEENSFIRVYARPQAGFTYSPPNVYNDRPDVIFTDQSKFAESYLWDFGDGSHSELKDPSHKYLRVGVMKVIQTVGNQFQCFDTSALDLIVGLRRIFVPNAFSPTAVDAVDRIFRPWSNGVMKEGYHLKIFSRWNDLVFLSDNEINGWDGKLPNGNMAPAGNYVWILDFVDFEGKAHRQNGTVMLIY